MDAVLKAFRGRDRRQRSIEGVNPLEAVQFAEQFCILRQGGFDLGPFLGIQFAVQQGRETLSDFVAVH